MTAKDQKKAAREFAAKWAGKGYEKGECQKFWRGLLHDVFGIDDPDKWVEYEVPVATGFVDAYIARTRVLIEQKGFTHGLADKAAMKQAMMYVGALPDTMPVRFPWPRSVGGASDESELKEKIAQTAQGILDARAKYPDCSLADLYDDTFMPPELRKAHAANDAAVMEAYGFPKNLTEPEIVARLFELYAGLTGKWEAK